MATPMPTLCGHKRVQLPEAASQVVPPQDSGVAVVARVGPVSKVLQVLTGGDRDTDRRCARVGSELRCCGPIWWKAVLPPAHDLFVLLAIGNRLRLLATRSPPAACSEKESEQRRRPEPAAA